MKKRIENIKYNRDSYLLLIGEIENFLADKKYKGSVDSSTFKLRNKNNFFINGKVDFSKNLLTLEINERESGLIDSYGLKVLYVIFMVIILIMIFLNEDLYIIEKVLAFLISVFFYFIISFSSKYLSAIFVYDEYRGDLNNVVDKIRYYGEDP